MLAPFLLPLLLAAVPAQPAASAPALAAACAAEPAAQADASCAGAPLCAATERVKLVCDLAAALEQRYVFFETKRVAAGPGGGQARTAAEHLTACVAAERAIAREDAPLRFYDRLRRCTSALEDGHLILSAPARLPTVALGIGLRRVEGRVVVATREERLLRALPRAPGAASAEEVLAIGAEVLEIDGRPAGEWLAELAAHVPGSSRAARLERAADALTRRDFLFPERRHATLTVSSAGAPVDVRLPWWISPGAGDHATAGPYVRRVGLETTDLVSWGHERAPLDESAGARPREGTSRTDPILPPREATALRELLDGNGRVAVRLGEVARPVGRAFCYAQVLTFHTETLSLAGARRPFRAVLDDFARRCKERALDVVVDLRHNEGGYLVNASALVASLLPAGAPAPAGALLLRVTAQNREVYEERVRRRAWPADGPDPSRALAALEAAGRAGRGFTPAFLEPPLRASPAVGGYEGRVVALVGPACMSACDRAAAMLRAAGRAVLLGEPTEGAGASQQEVPGAIGTRWTSPGGLVSLAIPNAAMGVPPRAPEGAGEREAEEFFASLALENRPVEPDVTYAPRLEDVTDHNRGWLARVEALLFPPEGDAVAWRGR